jgi:hypothetical protein
VCTYLGFFNAVYNRAFLWPIGLGMLTPMSLPTFAYRTVALGGARFIFPTSAWNCHFSALLFIHIDFSLLYFTHLPPSLKV